MAYTNCLQDGREHNWDFWRPFSESILECGGMHPFKYERHCQNMGCASFQYAEDLQPMGAVKVVEAYHDSKGKRVEMK